MLINIIFYFLFLVKIEENREYEISAHLKWEWDEPSHIFMGNGLSLPFFFFIGSFGQIRLIRKFIIKRSLKIKWTVI